MEDWRVRLRDARKQLGLSQRALAERAGVSTETVRSYESGRRPNPSKDRLMRMMSALDAPRELTSKVLEGAGFAVPPTLFPIDKFPDYFYSVEELQSAVELVGWPEFVLNSVSEVIAANTAVQKLWGIDFQRERATRTRAQRNLLAVASQRRFADRILNWDECVATLAAVFKGSPVNPASLEEPDPYFHQVLEEFAAGDPAFLARLAQIWMSTPARDAKVRWHYRIDWQDAGGCVMQFQAIVGTASEPEGLSFNDWIPMDAKSWDTLEQIKQRPKA